MRLVRRETELRQRRSGGDALVAMVQATNLGNCDDLTSSRTLRRAFHWAIFGKREVCPGSMVVVDVGRENAPKVPLVEDDNVIETFSAPPPIATMPNGIRASQKNLRIFCMADGLATPSRRRPSACSWATSPA